MFRLLLSPKLFVGIAVLLVFAVPAFSQDNPPPMEGQRPHDDRPNLLTQLGLSPEQVQQFRRLNMEHRPLMAEAQKRFREANRDLDIAIYGDVVSDDVVRTKLKAFQDAQAEVDRLRFANELAIRKLLTQEQLVRFRDMRRRFAETRQQNQRQNGRPMDRRPRRDMNPTQNPGTRDQVQRPADNQKRPTI